MTALRNDLGALHEASREFLSEPRKMLIGGAWVDAASGKTFPVIDPSSGEEIARVPEGDKDDIDRAVKAARAAFESGPWADVKPAERQRLLWRLSDLIEENSDELAELESIDNGKSLMFARMGDVNMAVLYVRYIAGWATKIHGKTIDPTIPFAPDGKFFAYAAREPVGVVGAIVPWNFPLVMALWKIGPALTTGCTIVLKPAEETPLTALRLGELIQEAGFPDGVVNVVTGQGETAGAALVAHPDVDKIAFTGSTEVGKLIGKSAMDTMKLISLECGGKSPVIVLDDADVEAAIQGAANAIFFNHGQVCAAGSRLYVQKNVYDQVVDGVAAIAKGIKLGPGLSPETQMGPLVSEKQKERVCNYINSGLAQGAEALVGGDALDDPGYYVEPTVFVGASQDMRIVQEEIFGPVLVAMAFDDLDEIAAKANDSIYGLAASIWSRDISKVHRLIPKIKAGTVWVNCHNLLDNAVPFGGYKQSGIGREMGEEVLSLYTQTKSVIMAV